MYHLMGSNVEKCLPAQLDSTGQPYRREQEQHSFHGWSSKVTQLNLKYFKINKCCYFFKKKKIMIRKRGGGERV